MTAAHRTRFYIFLNPYEDMAFTRCPKCEAKTKQRKLPLVVHVEPRQLCLINKVCRFCPGCELVIVRKSEIEAMLTVILESRRRTIKRDDYLVIGTVDRADYHASLRESWSQAEVIKHIWIFKDEWQVKITGGWRLPDKTQ